MSSSPRYKAIAFRDPTVGFLLISIKAARQLPRQARASVNNSQSTAMSSSLRVIVVCAALAIWLPAQAQYLGLGIEPNVELTKQDLDIIHLTVNEQVHGKPVGTTAKWSNPESQNSGKIALIRKFTRNGQQCETLDYRLSSCLQPDGQWRLI